MTRPTPPTGPTPLGPWLKKQTGHSYRTIAHNAGMHQPTLTRQLNDQRTLTFETLRNLNRAYPTKLPLWEMCRITNILDAKDLHALKTPGNLHLIPTEDLIKEILRRQNIKPPAQEH